MATNMRAFDASSWKSGGGYTAPFSGVIEYVRAKMEVASLPAKKIEDEDDEGVNLYKGNFSLTYGTLTMLREQRCT